MSSFPPFPPFNLKDPCAHDSKNLIFNGSMGPAHRAHAWGTVVDGWEPYVANGHPPNFRWVRNEQIEPGGSQQIYSENTFDAGIYQVVKNLTPGISYMIRWGYSLAAKSGGTHGVPNARVQTIGRQLGIDPYGGTDSKSPNVQWGQQFFDGKPALNIPALQTIFVAQAERATVFLRALAQEGGNGENRVWIDAICMEARPEFPLETVTTSQPHLPEAAQAAVQTASIIKWMPINDQAALYKFAQRNGLGSAPANCPSMVYAARILRAPNKSSPTPRLSAAQ